MQFSAFHHNHPSIHPSSISPFIPLLGHPFLHSLSILSSIHLLSSLLPSISNCLSICLSFHFSICLLTICHPSSYLLTKSLLVDLIMCSFIYTFIHPFIHYFIHWLTHSLTRSHIHYSGISQCLFICLFIHSVYCLILLI